MNRKDDLPLLEEVSRWLGTPIGMVEPLAGADCSGSWGRVKTFAITYNAQSLISTTRTASASGNTV
ncbi:MAG: hypothetical protein ACLU4J_20975 [Butyricimonas paravirosa]